MQLQDSLANVTVHRCVAYTDYSLDAPIEKIWIWEVKRLVANFMN